MAEKTTTKEEEVPLHDIVLKHMFEANKDKPAELSLDDIFWKMEDPSLRESQIGDVLKWLEHHRRVKKYAGKYSLDRFEFLDQKKKEREELGTKKPVVKPRKRATPKPKVEKKIFEKKEETPKEEAIEKNSVKKAEKPVKEPVKEPVEKPAIVEKKVKPVSKPVPKKEPIEERVEVKPVEIVQPVIEASPVNKKRDWVTVALLMIAGIFFCLGISFLIPLSSSENTESVKNDERITLVMLKLDALSEIEVPDSEKVKNIEERLGLIQELSRLRSKQIRSNRKAQNLDGSVRKLIFSNSVILLILVLIAYRRK